MKPKTSVLFVCLGNICRSPAADGILRRMVSDSGLSDLVEIDSAGTYGGHAGDLPDPRMRRAASLRGYDLRHRARQVREEDFDRFDMIVAMDDMNYEALHRLAPSREAAQRIFRMTEFCRQHPGRTHVPDPYYEGREGFELVLDLLEDGCRGYPYFCDVLGPRRFFGGRPERRAPENQKSNPKLMLYMSGVCFAVNR